MKILLSFFVLAGLAAHPLAAQTRDTLRNDPVGTPLAAPSYTRSGQWGYYLGHNYLGRQQFAEKYFISGPAQVLGVISHHRGRFAHPNHKAGFHVLEEAPNKYPKNTPRATKEIRYRDIDLTGAAMTTYFEAPVAVRDVFFVSFDLFDYSHGGYEGDSIALLAGVHGSRSEEDLVHFGRNVVQVHSHGEPVWRDYATQNFTNVRAHLALYPIVEFPSITGLQDAFVAQGPLRLYPPYPNPAVGPVQVRYELDRPAPVRIELTDLLGRVVESRDLGRQLPGEHTGQLATAHLPPGLYLYVVQAGAAKLASRVLVQ